MYRNYVFADYKNRLEKQRHGIQQPKVPHSRRAIHALKACGYDELAMKISNCEKGKRCSSLYCKVCRSRAASSLETRLKGHAERRFDGDEQASLKELRYLTVLFGLTSTNKDDVEADISKARKGFKALARKFPKVWMQGVFEFELIDVEALLRQSGHPQKAAFVNYCLDRRPTKSTPLVLVHCHCLLDLQGEDCRELDQWLRLRFDGPWQVMLQATQSGQSLEDKCKKIASYPFKSRVQCNMQPDSKDYWKGSYMLDSDLSSLIRLYDSFCSRNGFKDLLIGMKGV